MTSRVLKKIAEGEEVKNWSLERRGYELYCKDAKVKMIQQTPPVQQYNALYLNGQNATPEKYEEV